MRRVFVVDKRRWRCFVGENAGLVAQRTIPTWVICARGGWTGRSLVRQGDVGDGLFGAGVAGGEEGRTRGARVAEAAALALFLVVAEMCGLAGVKVEAVLIDLGVVVVRVELVVVRVDAVRVRSRSGGAGFVKSGTRSRKTAEDGAAVSVFACGVGCSRGVADEWEGAAVEGGEAFGSGLLAPKKDKVCSTLAVVVALVGQFGRKGREAKSGRCGRGVGGLVRSVRRLVRGRMVAWLDAELLELTRESMRVCRRSTAMIGCGCCTVGEAIWRPWRCMRRRAGRCCLLVGDQVWEGGRDGWEGRGSC